MLISSSKFFNRPSGLAGPTVKVGRGPDPLNAHADRFGNGPSHLVGDGEVIDDLPDSGPGYFNLSGDSGLVDIVAQHFDPDFCGGHVHVFVSHDVSFFFKT